MLENHRRRVGGVFASRRRSLCVTLIDSFTFLIRAVFEKVKSRANVCVCVCVCVCFTIEPTGQKYMFLKWQPCHFPLMALCFVVLIYLNVLQIYLPVVLSLFLYPPTSRIAPCVGTAGTVVFFPHRMLVKLRHSRDCEHHL